jgi:hypothetical protein
LCRCTKAIKSNVESIEGGRQFMAEAAEAAGLKAKAGGASAVAVAASAVAAGNVGPARVRPPRH